MDDPIVCEFMTAYALICALLRESARVGLTARDLRLLRKKAELVLECAHEPTARKSAALLVKAEVAPNLEQFLFRVRNFLGHMSSCSHPSELDPEEIEKFREWFILPDGLKHEVRASISSSAQASLLMPAIVS